MAQPIIPPDLIGAGVAQQPQPTQAPQQTTLPPDTGLLQMLAQPQAAANPGMAFGSGVLGSLAGQPGNQYLQSHMQQQQLQQQQMMQHAQMYERVQAQRAKREEGVLNISKDLLQSASPEARMVGARGLLGYAKKSGLPVQDIEPLVKSMATRQVDINAVMKDIELGLDDAQIVMRHRDIDPSTLAAARKNIKNDAVRRAVGLKTSVEMQKEIFDLKKSEAEAMEADVPELAGAPAELKVAIDDMHRRMNVGKGYREGDQGSKSQAIERAYAEYKAVAERKQALAEATEARKAQSQEQFNAMLRELVLGQGGGMSGGGPLGGRFEVGAGITPGGGSISLTPRKPLSGEAMMQVSGIGGLRDAINRIDVIREDKKLRKSLEEYIGPWAQYKIELQRKTPAALSGIAGKVPPHVTQLQQNLSRLENYTIRLITGAQMNQNEEVRIKKELPTMDLPVSDFWTRYDTARDNVEMMEKRVLGLALAGNQQAAAMAMELGLNIPGKPSPLKAPRSLRVRDKKTGRTGTLTLQPGEKIPDNVEVIE